MQPLVMLRNPSWLAYSCTCSLASTLVAIVLFACEAFPCFVFWWPQTWSFLFILCLGLVFVPQEGHSWFLLRAGDGWLCAGLLADYQAAYGSWDHAEEDRQHGLSVDHWLPGKLLAKVCWILACHEVTGPYLLCVCCRFACSVIPQEDFERICHNCMTYNAPDTVYYRAASSFLKGGLKIINRVGLSVVCCLRPCIRLSL